MKDSNVASYNRIEKKVWLRGTVGVTWDSQNELGEIGNFLPFQRIIRIIQCAIDCLGEGFCNQDS